MYASVMAALLLIGCSTSALAQDTADFWAARDTVLAHGPGHSNVRVGIWDSGVDTTLFRDKLARDANGTLITASLLMERRFLRRRGKPKGLIAIDYGEGMRGSEPPPKVEIRNERFGYTVTIETVTFQRLDTPRG